jgi:glycosyltransferase involved in cell wall biosynthesis
MSNPPLITVVVVACNSGKYIRETLDSILSQKYDPIELFVADDASTDDTVAIAWDWLAIHGSRFVSARILKNRVNTGISGNCNQALREARGAWLKLVAADDLLEPSCLGDCIAHVDSRVSVLFSRMEIIDEQGRVRGEYRYPEAFFSYPQRRQLACLLHRNCLPAPTAFIRVSDLEEMGGFDENYPMIEDLPLWIKLVQKGKVIKGLDKRTARYRVHQSLVYPAIGKRNERYQQSIQDFDKRVRIPLAKRHSTALLLTVRVDLIVDYIVQRPWLYRLCLPALWVWARFSPYTVPGRSHA